MVDKLNPLEKEIQNTILQYLELVFRNRDDILFWRENTVGVFDQKQNLFRSAPKFSRSGVPDIVIIKNGKFIGLEVKRKGTYQSAEQKKFQEDLENAGGRYYVVRSIDDVEKIDL